MSKPQPLSPQKYILTKARTLPIYKCYITEDWEAAGMVNVIVMRKHVNGKVTVGLYLVDLLCLGVKDTFYMFNVDEEELDERIDVNSMFLVEAEYNLVHNIIYAGHDFAMEFDIKPHKDFSTTKFILEEDNDKIPLIEIPVGDEDGLPHLMVSRTYNYAPALQKLKQNAGEGNYRFFIGNDDEFGDDTEDEEDEDDEDDDDLDDLEGLTDDENELLDFDEVADMETEELTEMLEEESENVPNLLIINSELLLRQLHEKEGGIIEDFDTLNKQKDLQLFEKRKEQWLKKYEEISDKMDEIYPQLSSLIFNEDELDEDDLLNGFLKLLEKHKLEDEICYTIICDIPLTTLLPRISQLEDHFAEYTPAVQLLITAYIASRQTNLEPYGFILNASNVEMAYPFNRHIHAMHHKLFWLVKAIHALQQDDKEKILYYHNLLRVSGTGGHIKLVYAALLIEWLSKYMGIELDGEEDDDTYIDFEHS